MKNKCFLRQGIICKKRTFLMHSYIIKLNTDMYISIYYIKPKILNAKVCTLKYKVYNAYDFITEQRLWDKCCERFICITSYIKLLICDL